MTMKLSPSSLVEIADTVRDLDKTGVEVKVFESNGHNVYLKKVNGSHQIVGITDKVFDKPVRGRAE